MTQFLTHILWPKEHLVQSGCNFAQLKGCKIYQLTVLPRIETEIFDERFTSKMAFQTMIDGGLGKQKRQDKALVDSISATIILQGYLEQKRNKQA